MFANYTGYSKNVINAGNEKNIHTAGLSFVYYAETRSTADYEQTKRALPEFKQTNGTTEGSGKGLNFTNGKVQGIFVSRRINQWRLSELS